MFCEHPADAGPARRVTRRPPSRPPVARAARTGPTLPSEASAERPRHVERRPRERGLAGGSEARGRRDRGVQGRATRVSRDAARKDAAAAGDGAVSSAARMAGTSRRTSPVATARALHASRVPFSDSGRTPDGRSRSMRTNESEPSAAAGRWKRRATAGRKPGTTDSTVYRPSAASATTKVPSGSLLMSRMSVAPPAVTPRTTSVAPGIGRPSARTIPERGATTAGRSARRSRGRGAPRHQRDHEAGEQSGGGADRSRHGTPGAAYLPPIFRAASTPLRAFQPTAGPSPAMDLRTWRAIEGFSLSRRVE